MSEAARAYATSFGVALAVSLAVTLGVRTIARRRGWVASPRPDRWHQRPTALYGGIGIWAGFMAAYLFARPASLEGDALLVVCASAMFLVGLVDDLVELLADRACARHEPGLLWHAFGEADRELGFGR